MFIGRKLVIATKHHKEKVIAPILVKNFGLQCMVAQNFDTDIFGTFNNEIERTQDALATAKKKCLLAMQQNNCDLGIASEGSFGAHPSIFFATADDEMLIFIDKKNDLEIVVRELTTETNFNGEEVDTELELLTFAKKVKFPSHGLILKPTKENTTTIFKGITTLTALKTNFKKLLAQFGTAYVATDMRALYNPTRMRVIKRATKKLAAKIKSCCPQCNTPGFAVSNVNIGLPCNLCGLPTNATLSYAYICTKCGFTKTAMYPNKNKTAEPTYCNYCNP